MQYFGSGLFVWLFRHCEKGERDGNFGPIVCIAALVRNILGLSSLVRIRSFLSFGFGCWISSLLVFTVGFHVWLPLAPNAAFFEWLAVGKSSNLSKGRQSANRYSMLRSWVARSKASATNMETDATGSTGSMATIKADRFERAGMPMRAQLPSGGEGGGVVSHVRRG